MRALLSVYDKTGIVELADQLLQSGVDLLSSGGTAKTIAEAGLAVTDVSEVTGFPPMLGHRVVTLHPKIHGGLLADRSDSDHLQDIETYELDLIDIVVGNLYPFASQPSVDLIDIGGPTLLRAAAKNHEFVTVLVDPTDYAQVLDELTANASTTPSTRRRLARKAFAHTAAYDAAIVSWFDRDTDNESLPESIHLSIERVQNLRYGENPHQTGARYRASGSTSWWDTVTQHSGLALSYLNLYDAEAAWQLVHNLGDAGQSACAIIKHANPCGAAVADSLVEGYRAAFACDSRSAFGGIVAFNRPIDEPTAAAMVDAAQADVVIAPGYGDGVVEMLVKKRKNTRLLEASPPPDGTLHLRHLSDSFLVQQNYHLKAAAEDWRVMTKRRPTSEELADAALAWQVCAAVTSNAIVMAANGAAWGIGAGQQNRVEAGQLAVAKADGRAAGGACASDAFFPFPDGLDAAVEAGVAVVVQPGGSVNDDKVIAAANEHDLAMVFTNERQFRH